MELDANFEVNAPVDKVWETVMADLAKTATVIPGAEVTEQVDATTFNGQITVKVGPLKMTYKGQVELVQRDDANHVAVLKGKALEKAGQGSMDGTATISLVAAGEGVTKGSLKADVGLSGRVAAMGKGVIDSVTKQMVPVVVQNIEHLVNGEEPTGEGESAGAVDGLAIARGVIGSMFHRDKKDDES